MASCSQPTGRADEWKVPLWEAIDELVRLHGGDPSTQMERRADLVVRVESAVELAMRPALHFAPSSAEVEEPNQPVGFDEVGPIMPTADYSDEPCTVCGGPSAIKVGQERPAAYGHNLTAYLCEEHGEMVLQPYRYMRRPAPPTPAQEGEDIGRLLFEIAGEVESGPGQAGEWDMLPMREREYHEEVARTFAARLREGGGE